ncbi:MAG: AMIN-like domain-containing (lipo)protein, partial [Pseudonocardiaceae bacterium]
FPQGYDNRDINGAILCCSRPSLDSGTPWRGSTASNDPPRRQLHGGASSSITMQGRTHCRRQMSARLPGSAFAEIRMEPAQAHGSDGHPSYPGPRQVPTPNLTNVMASAITGDFEGVLSLGVGMRTQTWVHTTTLTSPTRVVIDVGR